MLIALPLSYRTFWEEAWRPLVSDPLNQWLFSPCDPPGQAEQKINDWYSNAVTSSEFVGTDHDIPIDCPNTEECDLEEKQVCLGMVCNSLASPGRVVYLQ
jgi:hypothetical protein